jgi:hypothetical protein
VWAELARREGLSVITKKPSRKSSRDTLVGKD